MDDISSKITSILSDPQAVQQIKSLGDMLGLSQNQQNNVTNAPEPAVAEKSGNILSGLSLSGDTMQMITRILPILTDIGKEDDTTRLLNALRPFLSDERQKKLDSAIKIIRIIKLLPLIKDVGIPDIIV